MDYLSKIIGSIIAIIGVLFYAFKKGKQSEKSNQNEKVFTSIKEIKKRNSKRANDDISIVKQRLRRNARK